MPDLLKRRRGQLRSQFEALPNELDSWKILSNSGAAFEKHRSQIIAVSRQMLDLNRKVRDSWENAEGDPFDAIRIAQARCSGVHTIWNFFREKLILRLDLRFGPYLKAADYYAWSCYKPVLETMEGTEARREPPLVAFDSDISPWALSRQSRYDVGLDEMGVTSSKTFQDVLQKLPIPIIGIPWQSTGFVPGMAALAHETGHVVDSDFQVQARVAPKVAGALKSSSLQPAWSQYWWKEVFADLFACWAAGPSFVRALADIVPESPSVVATKKRPSATDPPKWGLYPPGTLRILLNVAALRFLGFVAEADEVVAYWQTYYPSHAMQNFEGDPHKVVEAVYDSANLPEELKYTKLKGQEIQILNSVFELDEEVPDADIFDPRSLVGAASVATMKSTNPEKLIPAFARLANYLATFRPAGQLEVPQEPGKDTHLRTDELFDLLLKDIGSGNGT